MNTTTVHHRSKHLIKLCKYLTTATMHTSDNYCNMTFININIINITHLFRILLKLLYLPFPALCTLSDYLYIISMYAYKMFFLANKILSQY